MMTKAIIKQISDCETRDDAVVHYHNALNITGIDWEILNAAIIDKWSIAGLQYIKQKAWG